MLKIAHTFLKSSRHSIDSLAHSYSRMREETPSPIKIPTIGLIRIPRHFTPAIPAKAGMAA
jgi:hypothetical protein